MKATAKIGNDTGPVIVLDGGGKVTLSGEGKRRILYMDTCDQAQVWTTSHCQDQDSPQLTVQNLTFVDGNSTGQTFDGGGGGAIFVRGGRFKVVNSRLLPQHLRVDRSRHRRRRHPGAEPVPGPARLRRQQHLRRRVGPGQQLLERRRAQQHRRVVGGAQQRAQQQHGHRPRRQPGRGGHARAAAAAARIYNDGNLFTLRVAGSIIEDNHANEGGGAIFFVSNDRTGTLRIEDSTLARNPNDGFFTAGYPGIFYLGSGPPVVVSSTIS